MKEAVIIYPHQLFKESPALAEAKAGDSLSVYLVEEPLILTINPIHRQKLQLHKLSLDAYETKLKYEGYTVIRLVIGEYPKTSDIFKRLRKDGVEQMHIVDTTDEYLERAIENSGIKRIWYESPLFILKKAEAVERFKKSKRFMASFYKRIRRDKDILMDENGKPAGGQWSFDEENRKKIPKSTALPDDLMFFGNEETKNAETWVKCVAAEKYGEYGCWLPYTHAGAEKFLQEFFRSRFHNFGPYEDAMTTKGVRLWHSTLSPLLNIGLLDPQQVLREALNFANNHDVPINSLEGFVRQIIGWREFIRASYVCDGNRMRVKNFFNHNRTLPESFWNGTTGIEPVDHVVKNALKYSYTHHIERLMVMGNIMLLSQTEPGEVYRWFMGMYIDAYDWVMVPNVYGMSQFADGGSFATKPYISGSNYIKKMSDFPSGDWENTWTALYWHFIGTNRQLFESNHRLSMMPKMLDRMSNEKKQEHLNTARKYLANKD